MSQPNDKLKSKTKKDLVKTIAERIDLPQLRTRQIVQQTFDALIDALVDEGRVELRNFGIFQIKRREARMARNPRTGQAVPVLAKYRHVQAGQGDGGPRAVAGPAHPRSTAPHAAGLRRRGQSIAAARVVRAGWAARQAAFSARPRTVTSPLPIGQEGLGGTGTVRRTMR